MFYLFIGAVFGGVVCLFILGAHYSLLRALILLEVLGFFVVWSFVSFAGFLSAPFTVFVFCLFVLEGVLGLVGFLNFIYYTGVDYVNVSVVSF